MPTPKERFQAVVENRPVDYPPVICPGGMMSATVIDVMNETGITLPAAHHDGELMARLAEAVQQRTGFDNFGIPFCMTVEAEAAGSEVDFGTLECEPKIVKERFPDNQSVIYEDINLLLTRGRVPAVIEAARKLSQWHPDIPVSLTLTGPISFAASLVDPLVFLKDLKKNPAASHKVVAYVNDFLIAFAKLAIGNGVDIVTFADPTATGEILGPKTFDEYVVRYLGEAVTAIHEAGAPTIVHICGDIKPVKHLLPKIGADVISTDAMLSLAELKKELPGIKTMGNLSTYLLDQEGAIDRITARTRTLVHQGINVIAPACGLSTTSPIENIKAFTDAVHQSVAETESIG